MDNRQRLGATVLLAVVGAWFVLWAVADVDAMDWLVSGAAGLGQSQEVVLHRTDPTPTYAAPVTPTRPAWLPYRVEALTEAVPQGIGEWVEQAEAVALVHVAAVGFPQYNTLDGNMPTAEPSDADDGSLDLYRPVKLDIVELYKGDPARTGFFLAQLGGERDGYELTVHPPLVFSEGGDGIVFVTEIPEEVPADVLGDVHMLRLLMESAEEYNSDDPATLNHRAAAANNWYVFSGSDATSVVDNRTLPISELISEIVAALE